MQLNCTRQPPTGRWATGTKTVRAVHFRERNHRLAMANGAEKGSLMRWLLQRGDPSADDPQVLTLVESDEDEPDGPRGIAALPGGALSITVRSAADARNALAELQQIQQELLTARARATAGGISTFGTRVKRQVQRPGRHLRRAGATAGNAARGFRPSAPVNRVRNSSSAIFDGLDAALLVAQTAGEIEGALNLVGTALEAVGDVVKDIDLGDLGDLGLG